MKWLVVSIILLSINCIAKSNASIDKKDRLLIAFYSNSPHKGIYLMKIDKDTTVFLIDSSKYGKMEPNDLRFIDINTIIYHGNRIYDLRTQTRRIVLPDRESAESLVLDKHDYYVLNTYDYSTDTFSLDGYHRKDSTKLFTIEIQSNSIKMNKYSKLADSVKLVYFPHYLPNDPSAVEGKITLKILDIYRKTTQNIDTRHWKESNYGIDTLIYFNPTYVRNDKKGKVEFMKIFIVNHDKSKWNIKVYEWDFNKKLKKMTWNIQCKNFNLWNLNLQHRIFNKHLYIEHQHAIYKFAKNGKKSTVYFDDKNTLLDFYIY
jgi:hypothetical protein